MFVLTSTRYFTTLQVDFSSLSISDLLNIASQQRQDPALETIIRALEAEPNNRSMELHRLHGEIFYTDRIPVFRKAPDSSPFFVTWGLVY